MDDVENVLTAVSVDTSAIWIVSLLTSNIMLKDAKRR